MLISGKREKHDTNRDIKLKTQLQVNSKVTVGVSLQGSASTNCDFVNLWRPE